MLPNIARQPDVPIAVRVSAPVASLPVEVALRLRRHRVCAPADRDLVLSACLRDRGVLPRWHQRDRGRAQAPFAYHEVAPAGAYAATTPWSSREHWLSVVVPIVWATHRDQARRWSIRLDTLKRVCAAKSGYADRAGRRCIVRPDVLASVVGLTERRVQAYNAFLRATGLEVVVLAGRMLTFAEKIAVWRAGVAGRGRGSAQRGLSTEVALCDPIARARRRLFFTPGRTASSSSLHHSSQPSDHPAGHRAEPAPPALNARARRRRPAMAPRAVILAKRVRDRVPWLAGEQPGRMAPALARFAASVPAWTADDIAIAVGDARLRAGHTRAVDPRTIRTRPAILLAWWLRQIDPRDDHPRLAQLEPEDLRCSRPDCDHGWLTPSPGTQWGTVTIHDPDTAVTRCPDCRPGAWPPPPEEDPTRDEPAF